MDKKNWLQIGIVTNVIAFIVLTHILFGVGSPIGAPWEVSFKIGLFAFSSWVLNGLTIVIYIFKGGFDCK